jgi:hypothetical protein
MKKIITLAAFLIIIFSSCKKAEVVPNSTCLLSSSNILGTYKITSILYKSSPQAPEIDYFMYYDECEKDNLLIFNSNNTFVISEGATACSPTTSESGNWNLNQSLITINSELGTITDFSCSGMKIKKVYGAEETTIILAKQ